jgi:hypothetical protein
MASSRAPRAEGTFLRPVGQHGIDVGEQNPNRKDAAIDHDLGARIVLELPRRDAFRRKRTLGRQVDMELQDFAVLGLLASQYDGVDVEIGAHRIDHGVTRRLHALLDRPALEPFGIGAGKGRRRAKARQHQDQ